MTYDIISITDVLRPPGTQFSQEMNFKGMSFQVEAGFWLTSGYLTWH